MPYIIPPHTIQSKNQIYNHCDMIWFHYNHENTVNKYHFVLYVRKIKNVKSGLVDRLR